MSIVLIKLFFYFSIAQLVYTDNGVGKENILFDVEIKKY